MFMIRCFRSCDWDELLNDLKLAPYMACDGLYGGDMDSR